ncbi:hypothetical protein EZS27_022613 [termite gut metagenome]|uniref:Uncharacterized protein n=1 Tax=termite gut metagenome TaxID=433724 RepID=A0A5J4R497_9ZZZZ
MIKSAVFLINELYLLYTHSAFVNLGYKVVLFPVFFLIFVLPLIPRVGGSNGELATQ